MIEKLTHDGLLLALIIRKEFTQDGIRFFTEEDSTEQLGYMKRPSGYRIVPHVHHPVRRHVDYTEEVLFIKRGKVRIDFYDEQKTYLESRVLSQGDVVLLARGGHGFEMIEETEIIEVKQGPYAGEGDKVRFEGIASLEARIVL